jgi:hypothetical protein
MGSQERPLQHSAVELQPKPCGRQAQMLPEQKPLQHGPQEPPFDRHAAQVPLSQILLQHSLSASQELPFGRHTGVVEVVLVDVEVVLVDVEVVLVGVVVDVEVVLVGVVVDVEVVLVGVVVDVLVEVEVVLVEVVLVVVGAAVVVVVWLSHGPRRSPWPRWPSTALLGTSMVFSAGVPGLWQMVSFFG